MGLNQLDRILHSLNTQQQYNELILSLILIALSDALQGKHLNLRNYQK